MLQFRNITGAVSGLRRTNGTVAQEQRVEEAVAQWRRRAAA